MFDVYKIRKDFPILNRKVWDSKQLAYLDNAATTQKPRVVIDELVRYYENYNANIHRGVHKLAEEATQAYEDVRNKVKLLLGTNNDTEVVFTRNTTESINLLANSLSRSFLKEGDEVLLTEMEHHSNIVPWFMLKEKNGIKVNFLPITKDYNLDYALLEKLITKRTKVISITHKSNVLGTVNDIKRVSAIVKNNVEAHHGTPILIVDAAQSVPHIPINICELGCDFLVFSSHKICGPTGVGVLLGKKDLLDKLPPFLGGGEMIRKVTFSGFTSNESPWKFEAGTPNIADVVAFGTAIDYVKNIGLENIYNHEKMLTEYCLNKLREFEFLEIYNPLVKSLELRGSSLDKNTQSSKLQALSSGVGIVTFSNPVVHPHDIATIIDQYGVAIRAGHHCAQPLMHKLNVTATCRASFYFYNTKDEIDIFIDALSKAFEYFAVGACKGLKQNVR